MKTAAATAANCTTVYSRWIPSLETNADPTPWKNPKSGKDSNNPDLERLHKHRFQINERLKGMKENWESKKERKAWDWKHIVASR